MDKDKLRQINFLMFWGGYTYQACLEMSDEGREIRMANLSNIIKDRFDGGTGSN